MEIVRYLDLQGNLDAFRGDSEIVKLQNSTR